AFGLMAALLAWARATEEGVGRWARVRWYGGALAFAVLALASREEGVILPGLVAIYELSRRRPVSQWAMGLAPFVIISIAYAGVVMPRAAPVSTHPRLGLAYLCAEPLAIASYLRMLVDPDAIAIAYQLEWNLAAVPTGRVVALVGLALIVLSVLAAHRRAGM